MPEDLTTDRAAKIMFHVAKHTKDDWARDYLMLRMQEYNIEFRCPECGYAWSDARLHLDHHLCKNHGFFPGENK